MKKLLTVVGALFVVVIGGAGLWLYWPHNETASVTLDESALGPCNRDRYLEYFVQAGDIAPMSTSLARNMGSADIQGRIITAFEAYEFAADTTYTVAAHAETGEVFASACADEKCTEPEFFASEQACLRTHLGGCGYVAIIYKNETYCTIDPNG